jgi:hypothetical protein
LLLLSFSDGFAELTGQGSSFSMLVSAWLSPLIHYYLRLDPFFILTLLPVSSGE